MSTTSQEETVEEGASVTGHRPERPLTAHLLLCRQCSGYRSLPRSSRPMSHSRQATRRNKHTSIEPDYDEAELAKALGFSDAMDSKCAIEIAHLASDDKLALKVLERIKSF